MGSLKIRKMTASFGKLKNSTLELGEGLNIISAPNEYGKSTWCGFISAMLYGIDTSERDKAGRLSAKTRFRPWDGGSMVGTMEVRHNGRDITIQRTGRGTSPMKNVIAVYTGTADFIKELNSENLGETLTGVTKPVFERTAFIRRPDIRVSQTAELERKIAGLVTESGEGISYTEADAALRAAMRKLRFNKSGVIPALEQELRQAEAAMEEIESSASEVANLRNNMTRLQKQVEHMENDLEIHAKLEQRAARKRLEEARTAAEAAQIRVAELDAAITKNGHKMTREDINEIREAAAAVVPLKSVASEAERTLWQAEKELSDVVNKRTSSPLSTRTEEAVNADIARGRKLEEQAKNTKERKIPRVYPIVLLTLAVLGLIVTSGLLSALGGVVPWAAELLEFSLPGIAVSLVLGAAGLVLLFMKPPRRRGAAEELAELLDSYGVSSIEKLASMLTAYTAVVNEESVKRAARDSARAAYESAGAAAQEASALAVEKLAVFMPEVSSGEEVVSALKETEHNIDLLTHAEFDMISARNIYETLMADYDPSIEVDDSYLPTPMRNREDTVAAIKRAQTQLQEATRQYDLATGAQRTQGDPAIIEGKIESLRERIAQCERRYSALVLAADTLAEANTELQTRFSPGLGRMAAEIMARLTDGRYEKLYFDKGFDASAKESSSPEARPLLALSDGTADEVYLSLRLAMCELLLSGDDPCPIVLDDALANFDDTRCLRALQLLREMAKSRQIILFSCHSREAHLMGEAGDVRVLGV